MKRPLALLFLLLLAAGQGFAVEPPGGGSAPLRMEDLEVRGLREKPEVLYLPVPRGIVLPSPVRYDLLLNDMKRPVFPQDIPSQTPPAGGTFEQGASLD
jgi:hypothetical protein